MEVVYSFVYMQVAPSESWTFRRHASSSPNNGTFRSVIKLLIIDFYFFIDHCFYTWAFSRLTYGNTGGLAPPRPPLVELLEPFESSTKRLEK